MVPAAPVRPALRPIAAWLFVGFGLTVGLAQVGLRDSVVDFLPLVVMGLAAAAAVTTGVVLNRPVARAPWVLIAFACIVFVVGGALRQLLAGTAMAPVADAATFAGYAASLVAFVMLLRSRHAHRRAHELIDGAIVLVSASVVGAALLTVPTIAHLGLSTYSVVLSAYPVVDAVMVFVIILLSWTSACRVLAFQALGLAALAMLVGDIGYATVAARGSVLGIPLFDLCFVVAFTLLGAAALHPSMRSLSTIRQAPVAAWSRPRLMILAPMLLLPTAVTVSGVRAGVLLGGVGSGVVTALLLIRAVTAVRDQTRAEQGLSYQTTHDSLTGLTNRARLVRMLDSLLARAYGGGDQVDVLFLDLDRFKSVNDTSGYLFGDEVLAATARRLEAVSLPTDVLARIGGGFVVVRYVGHQGGHTGEVLAADILAALRQPLVAGSSLVTTGSIGLASFSGLAGSSPDADPLGRASAESLLRDAQTAMYRAKDAGRDRCVVFDPSMHESVRRRAETEQALRRAVAGGELRLHYQPVVNLETGAVLGSEALVRWERPGLGVVPPDDFIPLAEETGLIVEIGAWVLSEALRQVALWRETRRANGLPDLRMAVNISGRQLHDGSLVEQVRAGLALHDVPSRLLVLEVTETAMMADREVAVGILRQLSALGVEIAVDDFGTGYSSLGHLRQFPVAKVKIDRSFVAGIEDAADDAEVVRAVVAMSLAMGLDVIAEGIETDGQRRLLLGLGVRKGQGWLFGRPALAADCTFVHPVGSLSAPS